jgi:hypothetical protein
MLHHHRWAALVAAGLLAACTTPYGERGFAGGYHDDPLDATHYRVKFDGNGNTQKDQVWNFWIYRCAELTRQKGYRYFTLSKDYAPLDVPQAPAEPPPGASAPGTKTSFDGTRTGPRARPAILVTRPGEAAATATRVYYYISYYTTTVTTWHTDAVVAMYNAPVAPQVGTLLDAQTVLDQLGPYVRGDQRQPIAREVLMREGLRWIDDDGRPARFLPLAPPTGASAPAALRTTPYFAGHRKEHA